MGKHCLNLYHNSIQLKKKTENPPISTSSLLLDEFIILLWKLWWFPRGVGHTLELSVIRLRQTQKNPVVKVFLTHGCYIFESLTHKSLVMFPISEYGPPITIQWEQFAKHFNAKIPVSMLIRPDLWNLQHVIFFKSVKELGGVWRGFGWGCMKRKVKHF